jgi:hypothetical protein
VRTPAGIALSWTRRTRSGGDLWDAGDVPLAEEREAYEIDILGGAAVKRTLATATPTVLYAAADEAADFGGAQASLTVAVHQMSAFVGRGTPSRVTLFL